MDIIEEIERRLSAHLSCPPCARPTIYAGKKQIAMLRQRAMLTGVCASTYPAVDAGQFEVMGLPVVAVDQADYLRVA